MNSFFLSLLLLLAMDVRCLEDISFQLSFLSLFCLMLAPQVRHPAWKWTGFLLTSAAVLIGTAPVVIYHFNAVSLISIVGNLFAIPMFHLALLSGFFALVISAVPLLAPSAAGLAAFFLQGGLEWIRFCAKSHWGYYFFLVPSFLEMILYYFGLGIFFCVYPKTCQARVWKNTAAVFALAAALVSFSIRQLDSHQFGLTLLSAGSTGLAHLNLGPGRHWLIHSGRGLGEAKAQWILGPYLQSRGIKRLSGLVMTDAREKNNSGFDFLKMNFRFEHLLIPLSARTRDLASGKVTLVDGGDKVWARPGGDFEFLGKLRERLPLKIYYSGWEILILPEMTKEVFDLLRKTKGASKAEVVIFPSGRINASREIWRKMLDAIDPQLIIAGYSDEVFEKQLRDWDIRTLNLEKNGAIDFVFQKNVLKVDLFTGQDFEIFKRV